MQIKQENSFAPKSFKGRKFFQNFFSVVFPLRFCTRVKKIRVVILKIEGRKNEKLKFIARFTKKKCCE